jgi:DNA-binding SARP family transcriptional activator
MSAMESVVAHDDQESRRHAGGPVEITLLDGFVMQCGDRRIGPRDLGGTKPRLILETLVLRRGAPVSKDALVDLLWDGPARGGSHANLETHVCVLRRRLHERLGVDEGLVRTIASGYALDVSRVVTDVDRLDARLGKVLHPATSPRHAAELLEAAPVTVGTLLFGEPDLGWIADERSGHSMHVADLLVHAAHKVIDVAPVTAETCARTALAADELNEQAWYLYLLSLRGQGRPAEAIRAYSRLRLLLADQLGCAPSRDLRELYEELLRLTSESDDDFAVLLDALLTVHRAGAPAVAVGAVESARRALLGFLGAPSAAKPLSPPLGLA